MVSQILSDIYWLETRASNLYLCIDEDGLTLIDCGLPRQQDLIWQMMAEIDRQPQQLKRILITHADIDHAGSAAAIQAQTGARVYAGAATAEFLKKGKSPPHMPWLAQLIIDTFMSYKPIAADMIEIITEGDELPCLGGLQVMATPGHTGDHHSFYAPTRGILFAGDALNTRADRIQRTPPRITADETAANRSAIRLLELAPAVIACGHGKPMQDHTSTELMRLFNKLRIS